MKRFPTLKDSREFERVYRHAHKWHSKCLVLFYHSKKENNVGFTVSKKIGNAVKRNFAKRRLRALFNEVCNDLLPGTYVFVAKGPILTTQFDEMKQEVYLALKKMQALKQYEKSLHRTD